MQLFLTRAGTRQYSEENAKTAWRMTAVRGFSTGGRKTALLFAEGLLYWAELYRC